MKKAAGKRKLRQFTVVIEQDEDGYYVATVPSLPGCYTQARTLDELAPRIRGGAYMPHFGMCAIKAFGLLGEPRNRTGSRIGN